MLRKAIATGSGLLASMILLGCASAPADNAPAAAATATPTASTAAAADAKEPTKPAVVQNTAQARELGASEEDIKRAYRQCMRKMRQITGSRIPRNACQGSGGLYPEAWQQPQEGQDGAPGLP